MKNELSDNVPNTFFEQIAPFERTLFGFIKARLDNDHHNAEEVLQTVLTNGWNNMQQQRLSGKFKAWVYRIAHNAIADFLSKRINLNANEKQYQESVKNDFDKKAEYGDEMIDEAWDILHSLPGILQEVYYMKHVEDLSVEDIAGAVGKSPRRTRELLDQAQEIVSAKAEKYLLGGFIAGINGQYVHSLVQQIQAKAMELYPEAAFVSASATTTAAGTGIATATEVIKQSFLGLCAAIALPFFWIMSLLIGTQFCGAAFVQKAPTLSARRWIVKHLLNCYCGIAAFPIVLYIFCDYIHFHIAGGQYAHYVLSVCNWLVFGSAFLYLAWLRDAYIKTATKADENEKEEPLFFFSLKKHIYGGFILASAFFLIFFSWFFFTVVELYVIHTPSRSENSYVMFMAILFALTAIAFHVGMFVRFQQFLTSCRDEETFQKTAPGTGLRVRDISTILLLIFAGFTIMPGILHLVLGIGIRPIYSLFEVAVFGILWILLWRYNAKHPESKEFRTALMLLFQMLIMHIARDIIYA